MTALKSEVGHYFLLKFRAGHKNQLIQVEYLYFVCRYRAILPDAIEHTEASKHVGVIGDKEYTDDSTTYRMVAIAVNEHLLLVKHKIELVIVYTCCVLNKLKSAHIDHSFQIAALFNLGTIYQGLHEQSNATPYNNLY